MDNNDFKLQACIVERNTVNIPRDEYIDLICARFAIEMIGHSFGRFNSPDGELVRNICMHFGYPPKEDSDA